jgi:hypothetical protein
VQVFQNQYVENRKKMKLASYQSRIVKKGVFGDLSIANNKKGRFSGVDNTAAINWEQISEK